MLPSGLITAEPFCGCTEIAVMVIGSPSGSKSLARAKMGSGELIAVATKSLLATGGLLPPEPVTEMVTVAVSQRLCATLQTMY